MRKIFIPALLVLPLMLLPACAPLIAAGVATGVYTATQERDMGDAVNDSWIETQLEAEIFDADPGLYSGLSANVIEGRVYLIGTVPSAEARRDATRIAYGIDGVREVHNDAEVMDGRGLGTMADDAWTASEIRLDLIGEGDISDQNYSIEVIRGTAYIMGIARDEAERDKVLAIARDAGGVVRVVDYTVLKDMPGRRPPDDDDDADDGGPAGSS